MVLSAASATGQDPLKIAAIMRHESGVKANATRLNDNGTRDYGLMQTNSKWAAANMSAAGITPSELAINAKGGVLDPQKAIMAGAMHLRDADGDLIKYGGVNDKGRAAAAQEQGWINQVGFLNNVPTDVNSVTASAGASVDAGSRQMFTDFNSLVRTAASTAGEAAAWSVNSPMLWTA